MMTETTNMTSKRNFLDEHHPTRAERVYTELNESEKIIPADLAQVVEKAAKEKQPVEAKIVEVKHIKEAEYVDPISEDYKHKRKNEFGAIEHRESKDGIKSIHDAFHGMGDQAEY